LSDPTQPAGGVGAEEPRRSHGYLLGRRQGILAVVVLTAACCASVLVSTSIDISPFARSLVSPQVSAPGPVKVSLDAPTPVAAVASWFAAVHLGDVADVVGLTTARAQLSVGRAKLAAAVRTVGPALGRPSIIQVERHGSRASVRLLVLGYVLPGAGPVSEAPLLISLAHTRAGWQIDDVSYLMISARAIRARARKSR
jgi:hypothetical protein